MNIITHSWSNHRPLFDLVTNSLYLSSFDWINLVSLSVSFDPEQVDADLFHQICSLATNKEEKRYPCHVNFNLRRRILQVKNMEIYRATSAIGWRKE
ncbi:hypothetical protein CsSME_00047123 [Camellia sinensis var. sinensis]